MGPGITLVVLGAILAFAVRTDASAVDLQTVGLIFMIAGAAIIAYYRRERHQRQITHVEHREPGADPSEAMHETITHEVVYEGDEERPPLHGPVHTPVQGQVPPSYGYDRR